MKKYQTSILFYYEAENEDEATGIAESIASEAEASDMVKILAEVGVSLEIK